MPWTSPALGVALMRASGHPRVLLRGPPARQARSLILTMFPARYQTGGYIPPGRSDCRPGE